MYSERRKVEIIEDTERGLTKRMMTILYIELRGLNLENLQIHSWKFRLVGNNAIQSLLRRAFIRRWIVEALIYSRTNVV